MRCIICGIDRTGKSTFIKNILRHYGPHLVIHSSSPPKDIEYPHQYQKEYYHKFFDALSSNTDIIFDRGHLDEYVYGPLYRGQSDLSYIKELESTSPLNTILVFLHTTDVSFLKDDGKSIDYTKRELEQTQLQEAFDKSLIIKKISIKVNNGSSYRSTMEIFNEFKKYMDKL
jgi:thymidylate kinase